MPKIPIHTETRLVEANGWVETGDWHTAMFDHPHPAGVKGCPEGRSQVSMGDAINDLVCRTNAESKTCLIPGDLVVRRHNGQPVVPSIDPFRPPSEGEVHEFHCAITDDDMRFRGEGAIHRALEKFLERRKPTP